MGLVSIPKCNECNRLKDQINHWFVGRLVGGSFLVGRLADARRDKRLRHYCGQGCLSTVFQRWLDTGSIDKPEVIHGPDSFDSDTDSSATLIEEKA